MPKVFVDEIKAYMDEHSYYCAQCGTERGLGNFIGQILGEDDLEKLIDKDSILYCDDCGNRIESKSFSRQDK